MSESEQLSREDYQNLLAFRSALRRFLAWSQGKAGEVGLPPAQYQLLLAIRGHPGDQDPTVGDVAGHLLLKPHSAVELISRAEKAGLVERWIDENDRRLTRVRLSADGHRRLDELAPTHIHELRQLAPVLDHVVAHAARTGARQRHG